MSHEFLKNGQAVLVTWWGHGDGELTQPAIVEDTNYGKLLEFGGEGIFEDNPGIYIQFSLPFYEDVLKQEVRKHKNDPNAYHNVLQREEELMITNEIEEFIRINNLN